MHELYYFGCLSWHGNGSFLMSTGCQRNGRKCLSIPALDDAQGIDGKHRFLFISEKEILHTAGNSLQISTLFQSDTVERIKEIPYLDGLNDNACVNVDPTSSTIFATAGPGRGFFMLYLQ